MVLNCLLVGLIIEFIITLRIFKNDLLSPAVLFNGVFVLGAMNLRMMVDFWCVELHTITAVIILLGIASFTLAAYLTSKSALRITHKNNKNNGNRNITQIPNIVLDLLIVAYVIVILLSMIYTIRSKGFGYSFSSLLSSYVASIEGEDQLNLPAALSILFTVGRVSGYIWCYLFAEQWVTKKLNWRYVALVAEVVIMGFAVGRRGDSISVLASLVFDLIILLRKRGTSKLKKRTKKKMYLFIALIVAVIPLAFQTVANTMGRDSYLFDPFEYISIYLGGPILNLDISIQRGGFNHPVPLSETFHSLYKSLGENLKIDSWVFYTDRKFLSSANGKRIGNVDTIFYDFYHDAGIIGVVILTIIMAVIVQSLYKRVMKKDDKNNIFRTVLFSYMLWLVARSFFANSFYDWFTLSTLRTLFIWFTLTWILREKIKLNASKRSAGINRSFEKGSLRWVKR